MNSIRSFRLAAIGAVALFGASTVIVAQPPVGSRGTQGTMQRQRGDSARGGRPGNRAQRGFGPLLKGITLSAEQQTQLKAVQQKYAATRPDSGRRGVAGGRDAGTARVRPDSATMARLRTEREAQFAARTADVRNILTAEQRVTFDQNVKTAREQMAARGGRGQRAGKGEHHPRNGAVGNGAGNAARSFSARR